jgi:uncharacterized protein DUF6644
MLIYDLNANPLNSNEWAFPVAECFHIVAFALSIGTIALVDLHLLGAGMRHQTARQLTKDTSPWTLAGFVIVIFSGLLIFSSDPVRYYYNDAFRFKIAALVVGIVYNYTIHRRAVLADASPAVGALAGGFSLLLWVSVVFSGLWIGFLNF